MLFNFYQFLVEKKEQELESRPLKGYTSEQLIDRINQLMEIFPDSFKFGIPSDVLGRAITYRDANATIEKIKDLEHYYQTKGEEIRFYCWAINFSGSWDSTKSLKEKIKEFGGFGEDQLNINLKKLIEYFSNNAEDSDNVRSISIAIDTESVRKQLGGEE